VRGTSVLIGVLCAVLLGACRASGPADPLEISGAQRLAGVPARYVPSLRALHAAVDERDHAVARGVLRMLGLRVAAEESARPGKLRSVERLLAGYERILDGRERTAAVELALACRPAPQADALQLVVTLRSNWDAELELRSGPALLRSHLSTLDPIGRESNEVREHGIDPLICTLAAGEERTLVLSEVELSLPAGALAGRQRFDLTLRAGEWREDGTSYPAQNLAVVSEQRFLLAGHVPLGEVTPAALAQYCDQVELAASDPERVLPPLLERTTRVDPRRHAEALDLLAPLVAKSTVAEVATLVPTLRWLTRATRSERDPLVWKRIMREYRPGERVTRAPNLDLRPR